MQEFLHRGTKQQNYGTYLIRSRYPFVRVCSGVLLMMATGTISAVAQGTRVDPPQVSLPLARLPVQQEKQVQNSVNLVLRDSTVGFVVRAIAQRTKGTVVCDIDNPLFSKRISVRIANASIMEAYAIALKGTGLSAEAAPDGRTIMVFPTTERGTQRSHQKTGNITGRITDSVTKEGIPGVTVGVVGTKISAVTRERGIFSISGISVGIHQLQIKRLGYRSETIDVTVDSSKGTPVLVVLKPAGTTLSEVVTTATGLQERIKVGNDIAKINVQEVLKNAPVTNMSELLTSRVPGVIVQKTSGAAGAPSVIRIRGTSSLMLNNDPIVIVDGIRIYSTVSDPQDGSIIPGGLAPSALDGIDLNSVETVEVLRGPSAAALYGTDAANGIIVVTTRRGQSGPTRWRVSMQQGTSSLPGGYPVLYRLWGRNAEGRPRRCMMIAANPCEQYDSLISFQILNDKQTTLFGRGHQQEYSVTVDGGAPTIQYSFTLGTRSDLGYEKLPNSEVDRLTRLTGNAIPDWQRRPNSYGVQHGNSTVTIRLSPDADLMLNSTIARQVTRTTPLVNAISRYFDAPDPTDSLVTLYKVPHYRQRGEASRVVSRLGLTSQWRPISNTNFSSTAGWERTTRDDRSLLRRGDCPTCSVGSLLSHSPQNDSGAYQSMRGTGDVISLDTKASIRLLDWWKLSGPTTIGLQYQQSRGASIGVNAVALPTGGTSFVGAEEITTTGQTDDRRVAGMFIDQRLSIFNKIHTGFAVRMDKGSGLGVATGAPKFPKLDFSIPIVTNENEWRQISMLRLRVAYGHAGVQPGITSRLRTFKPILTASNNSIPGLDISTLGNTKLRPERSVEFEGGMDLGLWSDRIELNISGYRKATHDLLISVLVPPSVAGGMEQQKNIGDVLNTGMNAQIVGTVLETPALQWRIYANSATNQNRLVRFSQEMQGSSSSSVSIQGGTIGGRLNVVGYPLNGTWVRPLISFYDVNGDGVLAMDELRFSDSVAYLGSGSPKFDGSFGTSVSLLNGRVTVNTAFNYQVGNVQTNSNMLRGLVSDGSGTGGHLRIINDTLSSMNDRASILSGNAFMKSVSSLRWQNLSISTRVPQRFSRLLKSGNMVVALQGSNLRLWSSYSGKDPNVRQQGTEEIVDNGQLPPSRMWVLRIDLGR